jgi:peptide/nickel transport system substrate-binding protein
LRKLGLNVELATSDWGTLVTRRASKKPIAEGGWNVFGTDFLGAEMLNPWLNPPLPANGDKAWFGWPKDDVLEALRNDWLHENDSEVRQEIAGKIQKRAFESVPYIPTGQYSPKTAYRKNLKGIIDAPALFMWNVEKA